MKMKNELGRIAAWLLVWQLFLFLSPAKHACEMPFIYVGAAAADRSA
jgi:hypothetical protein